MMDGRQTFHDVTTTGDVPRDASYTPGDNLQESSGYGNSSNLTDDQTDSSFSGGRMGPGVGADSAARHNVTDSRFDETDRTREPGHSLPGSGYRDSNRIGDDGLGASNVSSTSGPYSSNMEDKFDPRVEGDRDGRSGLGRTGAGVGAGVMGAGIASEYGSNEHHSHDTVGNTDSTAFGRRDNTLGTSDNTTDDTRRGSKIGMPVDTDVHPHPSLRDDPLRGSTSDPKGLHETGTERGEERGISGEQNAPGTAGKVGENALGALGFGGASVERPKEDQGIGEKIVKFFGA